VGVGWGEVKAITRTASAVKNVGGQFLERAQPYCFLKKTFLSKKKHLILSWFAHTEV
jgi:hypothetical protein